MIPIAVVIWLALLVGTGVGSDLYLIVGGAVIAVPSIALGVALHRAIWHLTQRLLVQSDS